jgi:hypothetical protein
MPLKVSHDVQPLGSFPAFYGTRNFITAFTRALHLYLSWARPMQSTTLTPISKWSILILSIHLRLGLPSGLFPSAFLTNKLLLLWKLFVIYKIPNNVISSVSFQHRLPEIPVLFNENYFRVLLRNAYWKHTLSDHMGDPEMHGRIVLSCGLAARNFHWWSPVKENLAECTIMLKNCIFWDVTPCGSCKNRRFGRTWLLLHQGDKNRWTRNNTSCN